MPSGKLNEQMQLSNLVLKEMEIGMTVIFCNRSVDSTLYTPRTLNFINGLIVECKKLFHGPIFLYAFTRIRRRITYLINSRGLVVAFISRFRIELRSLDIIGKYYVFIYTKFGMYLPYDVVLAWAYYCLLLHYPDQAQVLSNNQNENIYI